MSQSDDLARNEPDFEPAAFGRTLRLHAYGGREGLVIDRVPAPVPGPGKVLVHVKAPG